MKVIDNKNKGVAFSSLAIGDVFKYEEEYYIKTYYYDVSNALLLSNDTIVDLRSEDRVIPCKAELHIIE